METAVSLKGNSRSLLRKREFLLRGNSVSLYGNENYAEGVTEIVCMLTLLVDYFLSYLYSRLTQLNNIFNSG